MKTKKYWIFALATLIVVTSATMCPAVIRRTQESLVGLEDVVVRVGISNEIDAKNWGVAQGAT